MKRILWFVMLLPLLCLGQFSKTHYIPPVSASTGVPAEEIYLYISTPSVTPVDIRINQIGQGLITGTVSRDNPYVMSLGEGNGSQAMMPNFLIGSIVSNRGLIVEAGDMVYAAVRFIAGNGNQAGELVSKGMAGLGTDFRIGAMTNTLMVDFSQVHHTFASILATENNTTISFSDIAPGADILNIGNSNGTLPSVTLNSGESYVIATEGPLAVNRDALIGARILSDKPIVVNCGSFGGTNGEMFNLDLGFDQIVSAERTGKDYVFIKNTGTDNVEKILLIATTDNTEIFLSGNATPVATINTGDYFTLDGTQFTAAGNLFVHTSENVFAYQSIGDNGRTDQANQESFFVPPLSCETPHVIDNIPLIERVGSRIFSSRITLVTETGSTLSFMVDGQTYDMAGITALGATVDGPDSVDGNTGYETYSILGLRGNVAVYSSSQLYLASYGSSEAATFGGYFSGFTFKPEVVQSALDTSSENCLPNVRLSVNELTGFDVFQWFFNGVAISGATSSSYIPTQPGYYHVKAALGSCSTELESDQLPVSLCPTDSDNDGAIDNIDIDLDGDGIANCAESFGNTPVNMATFATGNVAAGNYSNAFSGNLSALDGNTSATLYSGSNNGIFTTRVSANQGASTELRLNFAQPLSLEIRYPTQNTTEAFNTNTEYRIAVKPQQTLTIDDPDGQLLIDTNNDGIFESGVQRHSSFEIRFRIDQTSNLSTANATFRIRSNTTDFISVRHINLSEDTADASSLELIATCVARDSDLDGVPDALDLDNDNDGIPDRIEAVGNQEITVSGADSNGNGIDDNFETLVPSDTDGDGIPDHLDLDSDNNGVFDSWESGLPLTDADNNGRAEGPVGTNGYLDALESAVDSGVFSFAIADNDSDGIADYRSPDNDGDGCNDVIEAGFSDANNDGFVGDTAPTVNADGLVTGVAAYTIPHPDINIAGLITILQQPVDFTACEGNPAVLSIEVNPESDVIWEYATPTGSFLPASDPALFANHLTNQLTISGASLTMSGTRFRAVLSRAGNACGDVSSEVIMDVQPAPVSQSHILVQCEPDVPADGLSVFDLSQADAFFNSGGTNFTLRYFLDQTMALGGTTPLDAVFHNTSNPQTLAVEITDSNTGCIGYGTLELQVVSQPLIVLPFDAQCESQLEEDGFVAFDLTSAAYGGDLSELTYYTSLENALLERNAITNPSAYTNASAYVHEEIFVRREQSDACSQIYRIELVVLHLPEVSAQNPEERLVVCRDNTDITVELSLEFASGVDPDDYLVEWTHDGTPVLSALPDHLETYLPGNYQAAVTGPNGCMRTIDFVVEESGQAVIQEIVIQDLRENNSVEIIVDATIPGDYQYGMDSAFLFQESPVFQNVFPGGHTLYIKDKNGCPTTEVVINVLGLPSFFSPNGDGYNDSWKLQGATLRNVGTIIFIFDRFGKLLKQISGTGEGWDGTLNGNALPADDYWYRIVTQDGREAKGHFSLIR